LKATSSFRRSAQAAGVARAREAGAAADASARPAEGEAAGCMQWPGSVDLMMRTFAHDVSLYPTLFDSISLFWPSAVGRIVVVISDDEPELAGVVQEQYLRSMRKARRSTELLPLSVLIEKVPTALREELFYEKQYSTMIFDRYSDADYVAILDTDAILQTYVTAQSLFAADGKPWLIGSKTNMKSSFINSTNRILGEGVARNNFMIQLPFVAPRALLGSMRADLVTKHSQTGNLDRGVGAVWAWWCRVPGRIPGLVPLHVCALES
jgi:hypothetical protein